MDKCSTCPNKATWFYAPVTILGKPFACDQCVPRGCSCNCELTAEAEKCLEGIEDDRSAEFDKIWQDSSNWIEHLDGQGKRLPCIEWWPIEENDNDIM